MAVTESKHAIYLEAVDEVIPVPVISRRDVQYKLVVDRAQRVSGHISAHGPAAVLQDAMEVTKLVKGRSVDEKGRSVVYMDNVDALYVYLLGWKWMGVKPQACWLGWLAGGDDLVLTQGEQAFFEEIWGKESVAWMRAVLNAVAAAVRVRKDP